MDVKLRIIIFILQFLNFVANLLQKLFGIKFKKISKETVLKGKTNATGFCFILKSNSVL